MLQRLGHLADQRRRFGYPRLSVLLRREGEPSGTYRIYHEEELAVNKRRARRKAIGKQAPILVEVRPIAGPLVVCNAGHRDPWILSTTSSPVGDGFAS